MAATKLKSVEKNNSKTITFSQIHNGYDFALLYNLKLKFCP